jgi:flagellin
VENLGAVTANNFTPSANLTINGEQVTGIVTQNDDADGTLVDAINALSDKTGVVASISEDNSLVLTAEDGRNIEVTTVGSTGLAGIADDVSVVTRGGLILQSEQNIVIGTTAGDAAPGNTGEEALLGLGVNQTTLGVNTDFAVSEISVTDREGANEAIDILDMALKQVAASRSSLGAVQNRMESTVRNLEVSSENLQASRGRIQDADFAKETATFSKNQIMQQAGVNILAQANQAPNMALSLLG